MFALFHYVTFYVLLDEDELVIGIMWSDTV
jgi:hypothetical protein